MSVVTGNDVQKLFDLAKKKNFAIPAVNVVGSNSINATLETAKKLNAPVIIQFSNGGALFNAGKSLSNENQKAAIAGAISGARHVHEISRLYGCKVIIHTDHAARKLLPWIDGIMIENEKNFKYYGYPLFSSHMIDLSEEDIEENISTCEYYLERMSKIKISNKFTIAAAFGNVHGVYRPGNVKLTPKILKNSQEHISNKFNVPNNTINFVFHGGSGSTVDEIREAISYGAVKMNIDTDMQYAFMSGSRDYFSNNVEYLKSQIGNPDGDDIPNKKYYDPRVWLRRSEEAFVDRLEKAFRDLNNINTL